MTSILALLLAPGDCFLGGFCGAIGSAEGPPPGMMFLAVGLVCLGLAGIQKKGGKSS